MQDSISVIQQLYTAFSQKDFASIADLLTDDVDWLFYGPQEIPFAGHYLGSGEVIRFFRTALDSIEFLEFSPQEFISASGAQVLVQGHEKARIKATGRIWDTGWAHVFTLRDGKIARLREYYDTAAIVAAFRGD